jgi:tetratricopeptide (TPR) repeat protein
MKLSRRNFAFAQIRLLAILLVIAGATVFIAHRPVLSAKANSFDDDEYLLDNNLVQNPGLNSAWQFLSEVRKPSTVEGYYQPLAMISLMLDYAIAGTTNNLTPFHITSLSLHAANTVLVIIFLYLLLENACLGQANRRRVWPAFFIGLLFGLHPMTVETIPWISERKTLLASFFALWCLIFYILHVRKPGWKLLAGVISAYILALMSKPTVTFLPLLLIILDFWPLRRLNKKSLAEKLPLLAIMVIFAFITFASQKNAAGVIMPHDTGHGRIILILCHNIIFYLYKIFWPVNLAYYPFPVNLSISNHIILAGVVGACIFLVFLALSLRWTRAFFAGWLFFFIAIFPTMGVIGFTNVIASDKYAYFPAVGFLMVLAWLLSLLWGWTGRLIAYRVVTVIAILLISCVESLATYKQATHWQTPETLYKYYLSFTPQAPNLHYNYGFYLYNNGRYDEAMREFSEQIRLSHQMDEKVLNIIGILHYRQGDFEQAIDSWKKTLEIKPDFPDALNNLAWIRATNADARFRNPDEAIELSLRACKSMGKKQNKPDFLETLAAAYASAGKFDQAVETARTALNQAQTTGKEDMIKRIRDHLALYQAGKPCLENHP